MDWTEGRKRAFITATLRGGMRRWPPKWQALADAYIETTINPKTKRKAKMYRCAKCSESFSTSDVEVDHIAPVIPISGFTSWEDFINSLYCDKENLQVLCKPCHKEKSKQENIERKQHADERLSGCSTNLPAAKRSRARLPAAGSDGGSGGVGKPVRKSTKGRKSN